MKGRFFMAHIKFMVLADVHWGVIEPEHQWNQLEFVFSFLNSIETTEIDSLAPDGDYWDSKLPMNSRESIYGIDWMYRLEKMAREKGIKKFILVKGTDDHDNMELEIFRNLEKEDGFFQIINQTTVLELSGIKAIFCPDETINNDTFYDRYMNLILGGLQIGFFHGSFDVVYQGINAKRPETNNVCSEYAKWNKWVNGPLIAGHWHDANQYPNLQYVGSMIRWIYEEENPKGFLIVDYDTDTNEYFTHKIINPLADEYYTIKVDSSYCNEYTYQEIIREVEGLLKEDLYGEKRVKCRILIYLTDEKPENDAMIEVLHQHYQHNKKIKIVTKDRLKEKKKKEKIEQQKEFSDKYYS